MDSLQCRKGGDRSRAANSWREAIGDSPDAGWSVNHGPIGCTGWRAACEDAAASGARSYNHCVVPAIAGWPVQSRWEV